MRCISTFSSSYNVIVFAWRLSPERLIVLYFAFAGVRDTRRRTHIVTLRVKIVFFLCSTS